MQRLYKHIRGYMHGLVQFLVFLIAYVGTSGCKKSLCLMWKWIPARTARFIPSCLFTMKPWVFRHKLKAIGRLLLVSNLLSIRFRTHFPVLPGLKMLREYKVDWVLLVPIKNRLFFSWTAAALRSQTMWGERGKGRVGPGDNLTGSLATEQHISGQDW